MAVMMMTGAWNLRAFEVNATALCDELAVNLDVEVASWTTEVRIEGGLGDHRLTAQ
jgi:hypothetical protein